MSDLTREQSMRMLDDLGKLEMERAASFNYVSATKLNYLHSQIEAIVVSLVRDTQHDKQLHKDVMAALDKQDIELDQFNDWLGKP